MINVMYALKAQKVGLKDLTYGLFYFGKKSEEDIITLLIAAKSTSAKNLGYLISEEYDKIISKTGTEIMTFKKFPDMKISNVVRYYELTKKEQEDIIYNMFITKETTCSIHTIPYIRGKHA